MKGTTEEEEQMNFGGTGAMTAMSSSLFIPFPVSSATPQTQISTVAAMGGGGGGGTGIVVTQSL